MLYSNFLTKYSLFAEKVSSAPLPADVDMQAYLQRLKAVQHEWQQGEGIDYVIKQLQQFHKKPIDASTGGSGFLPPESVEKSLREDIESHEMADYINHLPSKELIKAAEKHFKELHIISDDATIGTDPYDTNAKENFYGMHAHGTTELFSFVLKDLIKTPRDVIITSSPTYGLFIEPITQANADIATFSLIKKNGYKPNSNDIKKLILATHKKLREDYLATLAVTQELLTAFITSQKLSKKNAQSLIDKLALVKITCSHENNHCSDFSLIDEITNVYNEALSSFLPTVVNKPSLGLWQEKLTLPLCPRVRGYFHMNPHMPMGSVMTQDETENLAKTLADFPDLTVIDDLTYNELVLPPCKVQPGTFAKTKSMQQRSVTLYGISKQYGLAALRAGFALGPKDLIKEVAHRVFIHSNMPSIYSQKALYYVFNTPLETKTKYLDETLIEYAFRRDLTIALVQGVSKIINTENIEKIKQALKKNKITDDAKQAELLQGIPGLGICHTPESGFFLLLDFSAWQGKYIGNTKLLNSMDMHKFIYSLTDVNTVPSELNFDFDKPVLRFSFSMPHADIIEALMRIRKVLELCKNKPLTELKAEISNKHTKPQKPALLKTFTVQFNGKIMPKFIPATKPTHQHGTRLIKLFESKGKSKCSQ